jgi:hypothetical protein
MNLKQIDRLVASVPDGIESRQRRRIDGYAASARRCETRIAALRPQLERSLRAVDDAPEGETDAAADAALALLVELDELERVQPRIDSWLRVSVGAMVDEAQIGPMGEGPA